MSKTMVPRLLPTVATMLIVLLLGVIAISVVGEEGGGASTGHTTDGNNGEVNAGALSAGTEIDEESELEHSEPATALLFPWFAEALGVVVFFLLTRYLHWFPYTAVLFLLGTFMGIGAARFDNVNQLSESLLQWRNIDSELLLLVFLPGLIFHDAYNLNVYLFRTAFWQCVAFAFPMVLAGTALVACVAFYIFPFGWSLNLSLTFGSILAATDPVAVAALLNEVGAPPRLKIHISGEALLNDGAAIVFFTIFSSLYLYELGIEGVGRAINVGEGFAIFFRMSLGGALIGMSFGVGLLWVLYLLNRRLNVEENVLQITATITTAYLCFYTAEVVAKTSGVIATLACGVLTKQLGASMINDRKMMESFWLLVENLLNTLLFALGGVVWGNIIANDDPNRIARFDADEWGYLILLYVLLMAIRFLLFFTFYPLTARIGLGTSWQETVFTSWGGLRGAVGIALAIALDNDVFSATEENPKEYRKYRTQTTEVFGMVGGIAFFTLVINGTLSGPLLRRLGLTASSEIRKKVLESHNQEFREHILQDFIHKLCDLRFQHVDFGFIEHHISFLKDTTAKEFEEAVQRNKESVPPSIYQAPYTDDVLAYLRRKAGDEVETGNGISTAGPTAGGSRQRSRRRKKQVSFFRYDGADVSSFFGVEPETKADPDAVAELRGVFIELIRCAYQQQIDKGELDGRMAFLDQVLLESLDFAADRVSNGHSLNDYEIAHKLGSKWTDRGDRVLKRLIKFTSCLGIRQRASTPSDKKSSGSYIGYQQLRVNVHIALSVIDAHLSARRNFEVEFSHPPFDEAAKIVTRESKDQVRQAMKFLESEDQEKVKTIISHLLCIILLNKFARYIESVTHLGFLKEKEASVYLEKIEEELEHIHLCGEKSHGSGSSIRSTDGDGVGMVEIKENSAEEETDSVGAMEAPEMAGPEGNSSAVGTYNRENSVSSGSGRRRMSSLPRYAYNGGNVW